MSFSSDGRGRTRTDSGSTYGALDNPLSVEASASPASPLVAARLKAANLLHGVGLLLMLMIFCALVVLINSVDKLAAANSALEVGAATTRQVNSTADDAAALEPELEPDSEIPSCSFGGKQGG